MSKRTECESHVSQARVSQPTDWRVDGPLGRQRSSAFFSCCCEALSDAERQNGAGAGSSIEVLSEKIRVVVSDVAERSRFNSAVNRGSAIRPKQVNLVITTSIKRNGTWRAMRRDSRRNGAEQCCGLMFL